MLRVKLVSYSLTFFFQAEDGIRDLTVTGVQTCALPISPPESKHNAKREPCIACGEACIACHKGVYLNQAEGHQVRPVPVEASAKVHGKDSLCGGRAGNASASASEQRVGIRSRLLNPPEG